jgi:hypothetical protein
MDPPPSGRTGLRLRTMAGLLINEGGEERQRQALTNPLHPAAFAPISCSHAPSAAQGVQDAHEEGISRTRREEVVEMKTANI